MGVFFVLFLNFPAVRIELITFTLSPYWSNVGAVVRMEKRNRCTNRLEQIKLDVKQGTKSINVGSHVFILWLLHLSHQMFK